MMNDDVMQQHYIHTNSVMLRIAAGLFLYSLLLASWYGTWLEAIIIGGGTLAGLFAIMQLAQGQAASRIATGVAFMVMTSLHIHQSQGMLEIHFGVFVLLAILLYYRDWLPVVAAAATIAVHHLLFYYLQSQGSGVWILPTTEGGFSIILVHAAYVVVETAIVVLMAKRMRKDSVESEELSAAISAILQGDKVDLAVKTSGATPLLNQFDNFIGEVNGLVAHVSGASQSLQKNSSELGGITDSMKVLTNQQHSDSDSIASAVEQMSSAIIEVSSNAEQAADNAASANENARACRSTNDVTRDSIQQMAEVVSKAVATIDSLNERANSIGTILNVIRGIAEQTNLLALNAAIEAARAGEQGRGFAVVADEVRTLAQRTQESTAEIDTMIASLQDESRLAVEVIQSSQTFVDRCVENTDASLELMDKVNDAMEEITKLNLLIATATNEQSAVTQEIGVNVNAIVEAGGSIVSSTDVAVETGGTLREIADDLQRFTRRFEA